jgi:hypothetical protein
MNAKEIRMQVVIFWMCLFIMASIVGTTLINAAWKVGVDIELKALSGRVLSLEQHQTSKWKMAK